MNNSFVRAYLAVALASIAVAVCGQTISPSQSLLGSTPNTGGLTSYPTGQLTANLLANPSFEEVAFNGKPAKWSDNGFVLDAAITHSGKGSFRLTDPYLIPYAQSAGQDLPAPKGTYHLSGWIRMNRLSETRGYGVRICLTSPAGGGCSSLIKGTADWQLVNVRGIRLAQDTAARVKLEGYDEPDGTAWFDDIELRREDMPIEAFLLYPNYRGVLFDDLPQTVRFNIAVTPLPGKAYSNYQVNGLVKDEATNGIIMQTSLPAAAQQVASFDFSRLLRDRTYLVTFKLVDLTSGGEFQYPAYRISKVPGFVRSSMTVSFDDHNRFLLRGKPAFLLGVYDAGIGYRTYEAGWESLLTTQRHLFELPLNVYLNYWYGEAGNAAWLPFLNVLQKHGIYGLVNANCFGSMPVEGWPSYWFLKAPEADIRTRGEHPGFLGFYAADECRSGLAPNVFPHYQRMKALDPDGLTLGILFGDPGLPAWRDTVDVLGSDPYPLVGVEPPAGYPLSKVGDWTKTTREAVQAARPFVTTIQFFKSTSNSRWPTRGELRNMSYAAVAEGANGLFYWSIGVRGLAWVCSGWCDEKVDYFNRLKAVMLELKALEPALTSVDRPELLVGNNNPAVRTRVKFAGGKGYVIAYNHTNAPVATTFVWGGPAIAAAQKVSVYNEGRYIPLRAGSFSDEFRPYQAHVYVVEAQ